MIMLVLISHSGTMLSQGVEWAENQYETEAVVSHVLKRSTNVMMQVLKKSNNWAKNTMDFGTMMSYLVCGHREIWAPAILAMALMAFVIRFLIIPPEDKKKRPYVPKRYRKTPRIVRSIKSIWKWSRELLNRKLAKSHTYRLLAAYVDTWWRRPRNKRRLGRLRASNNIKPPSNRYLRTVRRKKKVRAYRRKDSYSRYSDAEEDHYWETTQFDRSEHPYYFDAIQFKAEWKKREYEYFDTMQFSEDDDEDEGMYVEFFDTARVPDDDEAIEIPKTTADAMSADIGDRARSEDHGYDSDSFWLAVDNGASRCITNCLSDYISPPKRVNIEVRGIGGPVRANLMGTVKWSIEDDEGVVHSFLLPNTYYNADSPYRLLSPQHMSQVTNDNFPIRRGTWCGTFGDAIELYWDQRKYQRTIRLSIASNIGLFKSAPGYNRFHAFCSEIGNIEPSTLEENTFYCMPATAVSVAESSDLDPDGTGEDSDDDDSLDELSERRHPDIPDEVFTPIERTGDVTIIPEDEDVQQVTPQAELLAWHYRLGHTSFAKIKQMAARGDLPRNIALCKTPKCAACLYGKATRRAWRSKSPANKLTTPPATSPGAVVAVDQMISATPGFIAQMRGFLTRKRYTVTTVFVDHFSGLSFVYLQKSTSAAETVEAKKAFERYAKVHGVQVRHYHADNGIFAEAEFRKAVEVDQQSISYCAVNAHHQNGKAEKKIRDLQELARTMLLHAKQRWPNAVTSNLWPYAMRMANDVSNFSPGIIDGISPLEKFGQVAVSPRVKHSHTFGSPVYVLDTQLQAGKSVPKWNQKSRIGMYLGTSPRHSRKVALVLNLQTGHVSPQFHVKFDDLFETLRPSAGNVVPTSLWSLRSKASWKSVERVPARRAPGAWFSTKQSRQVALLLYVDDGIFCGPSQKDIDEAYNSLVKPLGDHPAFKMTDEGTLCDYLGVKVDYLDNGTIKLSQPHLIQQILDDLGFNDRTGTKATPAASSVKLSRDLHGKPFDEEWHYRSVVGKLNFLEKSTRLDIAYSVHQCARFSTDPRASHAAAIKRIGKYLLATKDKGMILNPQGDHSFDCWCDADFCGNWDRVNADVDPSTAKSRTGYVITYASCPIVWASKLQPYVALSTTEAEYGALSTSLRDVIHMMQIVEESSALGWKTFEGKPTVHCKAFEDNSGTLEWARLPKMRSRTKHLNIRMHHFREFVRNGIISINKIPTRYQLGDIATKPQPEDLFVSQRESLMQWESEFMSKEELRLPAHHMRACDISEQASSLCGDGQHEDAVRTERSNVEPAR
jgi:hypothetical protein